MTLNAAIRKAEIQGSTHVSRLSQPAILRGIRTAFDAIDHTHNDWHVVLHHKER